MTGLKPYEQYFYRFETKDGSSQVGPLPHGAAGRLPRRS